MLSKITVPLRAYIEVNVAAKAAAKGSPAGMALTIDDPRIVVETVDGAPLFTVDLGRHTTSSEGAA